MKKRSEAELGQGPARIACRGFPKRVIKMIDSELNKRFCKSLNASGFSSVYGNWVMIVCGLSNNYVLSKTTNYP